MSDLIVIHDFTESAVGEPLILHDGRVEVCPACGRPAWAQRYTSYKGRHPAHYLHRSWMDDETGEMTYERCFVEDAPRGDGLSHAEAAALEAWAGRLERHCALLKAALGTGWYDAPTDGRGTLYRLMELNEAVMDEPTIVAAGPTPSEIALSAVALAISAEADDGR
jgi:hypothetical protein